ncbi:hypothetical protein PLICRDRAFT_40351 [Plicaturopsis crispa FD-325 SS-3]|nr:hypothetical protein PLICRDRAFT_40351 [Plicaturopsis crispa FD-325 SS-3]
MSATGAAQPPTPSAHARTRGHDERRSGRPATKRARCRRRASPPSPLVPVVLALLRVPPLRDGRLRDAAAVLPVAAAVAFLIAAAAAAAVAVALPARRRAACCVEVGRVALTPTGRGAAG